MRKNKGFTLIELLVVIAIICILVSVGVATFSRKAHACGWFSDCSGGTTQQVDEQQAVADNQAKLQVAVPLPQLDNSLERANISKRLSLWNDPAKISYVYLTSYGKVMAFYTVKGKITSGSKRLTSQEKQVGSQDCGQGNCELVMESPELDGTYGSSASYIYFWTTEGAYVQWNGEYMLSDQPLKLTTTPELVREIK